MIKPNHEVMKYMINIEKMERMLKPHIEPTNSIRYIIALYLQYYLKNSSITRTGISFVSTACCESFLIKTPLDCVAWEVCVFVKSANPETYNLSLFAKGAETEYNAELGYSEGDGSRNFTTYEEVANEIRRIVKFKKYNSLAI